MKKVIGFIGNNWAKLLALILLTILVVNVSRACHVICHHTISASVDVESMP